VKVTHTEDFDHAFEQDVASKLLLPFSKYPQHQSLQGNSILPLFLDADIRVKMFAGKTGAL
jgi:hypothetical protein